MTNAATLHVEDDAPSAMAITARAAELARREKEPARFRTALLGLLRNELNAGRAVVRARFESGGSGSECVRGTAWVVDQIVQALADVTVGHVYQTAGPTRGEQLSIVAVGGYGRGELAPSSDIDLMFLLPYKRTPRVEQIVEYMLYMLWDLGLKVGHSVRSAEDAVRQAQADLTIRTALLETRRIWGDAALFRTFKKQFAKVVVHGTGPAFAEGKLAERDARHQRMGDSRYVLEPNLKDGKGGLRDLQTLFWIAKYLYEVEDVRELVKKGVLSAEEARRFDKAQNFLWTARCHLHYLAGRAEDRLTFDVQPEIAARMGYTDHAGTKGVERFMKHYFLVAKTVGDLTRIFCAVLEAESKRPRRMSLFRLLRVQRELEGFVIDGDRLSVSDERHFHDRPVDMIRLFHASQAHGLDIHPTALRALTRALGAVDARLRDDPEANRLFLDILTCGKDPEIPLRRMNEAGLLGRFVPDWGRVVAQMQYDMYHVFTVDEHTLQALGILHRIETGQLKDELPVAAAALAKIASRRALYVAMFLHDIAKGRGGDHSVLGARVAERLGPRFGLTGEETETVAWLVRHHLDLSSTAFKRDIEDETTVRDLVELVQSPERLRLLLALTTADISAVGPGRWNAWRAALLSTLFDYAEERLLGGHADGVAAGMAGAGPKGDAPAGGPIASRPARIAAAQEALRAHLSDWPAEELDRHMALGYAPYWLSFDPDTHARHARLIRQAEREQAPLTVDTRVDEARAVTEVTIYTADHAGLFSRLAGAFAVSGASIVDARIFTLSNGMALDVFSVQDASGGSFASSNRLAKLVVNIERTLSGELRPVQELAQAKPALPSRTAVFQVPPRVIVDNKASQLHTVVEVNGRDRPGLLYDLTRALTGLSLQISSAKISTYGETVVDVFYVRDLFGLKVINEVQLNRIRERLLAAFDEPESPPAEPVRPRRLRRARVAT